MSFYNTGNSKYSSMICQETENISISQSSKEAYVQEKRVRGNLIKLCHIDPFLRNTKSPQQTEVRNIFKVKKCSFRPASVAQQLSVNL